MSFQEGCVFEQELQSIDGSKLLLAHAQTAYTQTTVEGLEGMRESLATVAAARLADAHPMLRLANSTMSQASA
eukprot:4244724-Amphidinium_carterae.1